MKKMLVPCALDPPNPKCYVCAAKPEVSKVTPRAPCAAAPPCLQNAAKRGFPSNHFFYSFFIPICRASSLVLRLLVPMPSFLCHANSRCQAGYRRGSLGSPVQMIVRLFTIELCHCFVDFSGYCSFRHNEGYSQDFGRQGLSPHLRPLSAVVMYRGLGVAGQLCNAQVLRRKFDTWYQTSRASKGRFEEGPGTKLTRPLTKSFSFSLFPRSGVEGALRNGRSRCWDWWWER